MLTVLSEERQCECEMWLPTMPYYRFVVMMVAFFCLMSIFSNYTIMNFAFICMKNDMNGAIQGINGVSSTLNFAS